MFSMKATEILGWKSTQPLYDNYPCEREKIILLLEISTSTTKKGRQEKRVEVLELI